MAAISTTPPSKAESPIPNCQMRSATARDRLGLHLQRQGPGGLASVKIEDETRTLRKGDIVAGEHGLVVAGRSADRRGASLRLFASTASAPNIRACRWYMGIGGG